MTGATDWPTAFAILAAGVVLGTLVVYVMRRSRGGVPVRSSERDELEARRDSLLQQIAETTDANAREELELEAATVLRALDFCAAPDDEAAALPSLGFRKRHPVLNGYLWGFGSSAAIAFLGFYGYSSAQPRNVAMAAAMAPAAAPAATAESPAVAAGQESVPAVEPVHLTLSFAGAKPSGGVVYVIARAEAQAGGHPVAVKRIDPAMLPTTIDLGPADAMMGQPFPGTVDIEARLDSDGDVMTAKASDPKATAAGVAAGATLALTLK